MKTINILLITFLILFGFSSQAQDDAVQIKENHLIESRNITFQYENFAPIFDLYTNRLFFQSNDPSIDIKSNRCYQIYSMDPFMSASPIKIASDGMGTCENPNPNKSNMVFYASTKEDKENCDPEQIYHPLISDFYYMHPKSEIIMKDYMLGLSNNLTSNEVYDGQPFFSEMIGKIFYVSTETGDPEIYSMDIESGERIQITDELGAEFFPTVSHNGERLLFCASRPSSIKQKERYKKNLKENKVSLENMELYSCRIDGSDMKKLTDFGASVITPCFDFTGERILFSSNHDSDAGRQIYRWSSENEEELEQITYVGKYNAFPRFSVDGQFFTFSSDRNLTGSTGINVIFSRWED